jgi:hypothetical protein
MYVDETIVAQTFVTMNVLSVSQNILMKREPPELQIDEQHWRMAQDNNC